ncbi:MAG: alpha/beta hydrolase [Synechococcus sp.]
MPSAAPAPLRFQPDATPEARLVLLHGWGADADDLLMLGRTLAKPIPLALDVVALPAPEAHPQGIGRQWYGLFPADWDAVPRAEAALRRRLLDLAEEGIPLNRTVVLGFSQGAAMALSSGCDLPFAGLIACSGYPHPNWTAPTERPPVLLIHGREDDVVPCSAADEIQRRLVTGNAAVQMVTFEGGHTIPDSVLPTISNALNTWLAKAGCEG